MTELREGRRARIRHFAPAWNGRVVTVESEPTPDIKNHYTVLVRDEDGHLLPMRDDRLEPIEEPRAEYEAPAVVETTPLFAQPGALPAESPLRTAHVCPTCGQPLGERP